MFFTEDDYGFRISQEMSEHLRKYTGYPDRLEASELLKKRGFSLSASIIQHVVYRQQPLTERNARGVVEMAKLALRNCKKEEAKRTETEIYLTKLIQPIEC